MNENFIITADKKYNIENAVFKVKNVEEERIFTFKVEGLIGEKENQNFYYMCLQNINNK